MGVTAGIDIADQALGFLGIGRDTSVAGRAPNVLSGFLAGVSNFSRGVGGFVNGITNGIHDLTKDIPVLNIATGALDVAGDLAHGVVSEVANTVDAAGGISNKLGAQLFGAGHVYSDHAERARMREYTGVDIDVGSEGLTDTMAEEGIFGGAISALTGTRGQGLTEDGTVAMSRQEAELVTDELMAGARESGVDVATLKQAEVGEGAVAQAYAEQAGLVVDDGTGVDVEEPDAGMTMA
jgi:hypothetical protein